MESPRSLLPLGKFHSLPLSGLAELFDLLSHSLRRTNDLIAVLLETIFACFHCTV